MSGKVEWNGASVTATLLAVSSIGAAAACVTGHVDALLPVDLFGELDPLAGSLLSIQCFAIGVLTLCSVYNNYAPLQLKFHAVGVIFPIAFAISLGFWVKVVQSAIISLICAYFGFTADKKGRAEYFGFIAQEHTAASGKLSTILMSINLLLLVVYCATPFFMSVDELFPQFQGRVNTLTFRMCMTSTVVYVVPMAGAVLNNRASQVQPWWAACLFFNAATNMMMDPIDTQNAVANGVLAVVHILNAFYNFFFSDTEDAAESLE